MFVDQKKALFAIEELQPIYTFYDFCSYALSKTQILNEENFHKIAAEKGFPDLARGSAFCLANYLHKGGVDRIVIVVNKDHFQDHRELIPYTIAHEIVEIFLNYQWANYDMEGFIKAQNSVSSKGETESHFRAEEVEYTLAYLDGELKHELKYHQSMMQKSIEDIKKDHKHNPWFILEDTVNYELEKMKRTRDMAKRISNKMFTHDELEESQKILTLIKDWLALQDVA